MILFLIAASVYQLVYYDFDLYPNDIRIQIFHSNTTATYLDLESWMSLLPTGTEILGGAAPGNFYLFVWMSFLFVVYLVAAAWDSIVITSSAVYYYVVQDELPPAREGQTIVNSYINCYEAMSDTAKTIFGLLLLDSWLLGTASRVVHFVITAIWLAFWNFPSNGTKIYGYLLLHAALTVVFYVVQFCVFVIMYGPQVKMFMTTNIWSFPEIRGLFISLRMDYNILTLKILLLISIVYSFLSTMIRKRVNVLVFDPKPVALLVERDSNNLKKVIGAIVDQAFSVLKTSKFVSEAAMPQSDFHTATCPKWQVFFTADSIVIGSGFVCKRGVITVLHVYQVLTCEARAGKEIRVVGPKGSAKFPKHQLLISVEVSETIALKVDPSLYSVIGAKSISLKNVKPCTPGPVSIYGHKDGVVKRTMGAITGRSDTGLLNFNHDSSTMAGWSGSPLFSGDNIVGIHRGSDGIHNICENVYVGLGCHRAAIKEIRDIYRKAKDTSSRVVVLESLGDASTTPSLNETGRQLTEDEKTELRAARLEEVEEKYRNVQDEVERKGRIRRDMIEYDDDLADLDGGTLMSIYADLMAFGTLTEDQEERLGVRANTLAKSKSKKNAGKISDEAIAPVILNGTTVPDAPQMEIETRSVAIEQPRVSPVQVLVPRTIVLEADAEPASDFQPGPAGLTVKTPSSSSSASVSQPAQAKSTTKTSGPSLQSSRKSQPRSPTPLTSPTVVITPPVTVLPSTQVHQQFPVPATVKTLTRNQRRELNSSLRDLEARAQEVRLLLAKGTSQESQNQSASSQPQPSSQPSAGTNTPQPAQPPSAGA